MGRWRGHQARRARRPALGAIEERIGALKASIESGLLAANARSEAIENKIGGGIRWIMEIVASLAVALVLMFLNDSKTRAQADESDKREMRARLSLLTQQLANDPPPELVVTPPGSQTAAIPTAPATPLDADDLSDASGGTAAKPSR